MNKTFRVIFNHTTQQWVAVSELARVNGKKTHTQSNQNSVSGSLKKAFAPLCLALMGVLATYNANAAEVDMPCKYDDVNKTVICGFDNTVRGEYSTAIGNTNSATSNYGSAVAIGYENVAYGSRATAIGNGNSAQGTTATAIGTGNDSANQSAAIGNGNQTEATGSSAIGYYNIATAKYSTAIGASSKAVVEGGTAIGHYSYADRKAWDYDNDYSAAFVPSDMSAFNEEQEAVWRATSAALAVGNPNGKGGGAVITRQITGVAAGSEDTDAVNVAQLVAAGTAAKDWVNAQGFAKAADVPCSYDANGNLSCGNNANNGVSASTKNATVLGIGNNESFSGSTTVGDYSVAVGHNNNYSYSEDITVGGASTAVGVYNTASGQYSSAVGYNNTASDEKSTAMGYHNTATLGSTALGSENNAEGATTSFVMTGSPTIRQYPSLAVGNENNATVGATALGSYNTATGVVYDSSNPPSIYSTSIAPALAVGVGNTATATGRNSAIAMGIRNTANANGVVAVGYNNTASGNYSSVFGAESQAIVDYGTAIGYQSYADRAAWSDSNNYSAAFAPSDMSGFDAKQKAAWQATSAALAVGDPDSKGYNKAPITRQITGVAAGSQDTDAVNVAQLKEVAAMVGSGGGGTAFSPITVTGNTGNFTVGSAGKLNIRGDNTTITTEADGGTVTIGLSSALKTQINTAIATVGTLSTTVTNLGTTVAGLETEIKAVETNVVAYDSRITANENQITQLENNHNALSGEVTNISNAMANKADQSWVTDQINNAALGGTGVNLSEYAKTADANAYADTAANTAENNAKGYTDSEVAKAKTAANTYADTAANKAKTDAQTYADNAVKDKATQSWVKDEINKAALSGTGVDLSEYAKTADANAYADTAANTAETNAKGYTDSEVAKAKTAANTYADTAANKAKTDAQTYADNAVKDKATQSWVKDEINKAALSGTGVDLSEYAKTADANAYADTAANTAENNAKGYTDSEVAKAKSYADNAANTAETNAKGYTDSKLGDYSTTTDMNKAIDTAKADANKYADTAANKAQTDANAYTDGKLADNATQSWVNNQKFAKQQAVTDLNSRVDKLVVAGGGYEHITVAGENGSFNVANKETAKFVGDGKNITTDATGGEVKISLADDIAVNSVKVGNNGVALTANGLNNGGQVISNVAAGVRPTDAVNVSQLNHAMGGVYGRIDSMEKHANAGIAQAMASGSMASTAKPGKGMLAIAGSSYRGESGYAIGYSQMSESGKWLFRATGSGNSRGHYGVAASVGLELW